MNLNDEKQIKTAELVLSCADFDKTFEFFTEFLKFKIIAIFPADDPTVAIISNYGLRLRLEKNAYESANKNLRLRLLCDSPEKIADGQTELIAPNGVKIELIEADPPIILPEIKPEFVLTKFSENADWIKGRAGMRYRDLIPGRLGGRYIASHIHIPKGGEVPDYVHFHKVRFQMIFCYKGWAKLVYEDQGEPFLLNAGDCVLQPPEIRHRVLESSDNLEVIEIGCPAEHETFAEHEMSLPTDIINPDKDFGGQKFTRHISNESVWKDWRVKGFKSRDTGIASATNGLASVCIMRPISTVDDEFIKHDAEFMFVFILHGKVNLKRVDNKKDTLTSGDSIVIPVGMKYAFADCSDDLEMLEVIVPDSDGTRAF